MPVPVCLASLGSLEIQTLLTFSLITKTWKDFRTSKTTQCVGLIKPRDL